MIRYCFALDLINEPAIIEEYEYWHKTENRWPEIMQSILQSGVTLMEIYRTGNRLFMIMEVTDSFTFEHKNAMDKGNATVERWEKFMWKFQQPLQWAKPGEKWILMDKIFGLPV